MDKPILVDLLHDGFKDFWFDMDLWEVPRELPNKLDWEFFMKTYYNVDVIATKREAEVWMDEKDLMWFRLKWGSGARTSEK